jgi:hypothetical protein
VLANPRFFSTIVRQKFIYVLFLDIIVHYVQEINWPENVLAEMEFYKIDCGTVCKKFRKLSLYQTLSKIPFQTNIKQSPGITWHHATRN